MREFVGREVNEAFGVGAFLRRWLGEAPPISQNDPPRRSSTGNINLDATEGSSPSALLAFKDEGFFDFLEPGVAPLVRAAIVADLITYSSCEGHLYADGTADELHVGILARNAPERERVVAMWASVAAAWNDHAAGKAIEPALARGHVHCDGRLSVPIVDLYLCRRSDASWEDYFAERDNAANRAATLLQQAAVQCV